MKLKAITLFVAALFLSFSIKESHEPHRKRNRHCIKPVEKVLRLDSVVVYKADILTGDNYRDYMFAYQFDRSKANPSLVVRLNLPEKDKVNRQVYDYDHTGFKTKYLYQEWSNGRWEDRMLVKYEGDKNGKLLHELFSSPDLAGKWVPYQQHFYHYDDAGRVSDYLRKMKGNLGDWYDFSENIRSYDEEGRLENRYEKRVADDYVIWTESFFYGDDTTPTERIRQTMRYNQEVGHNTLTNDTRNLYYYNEFEVPIRVEQYAWDGTSWLFDSYSAYYYSFIPGRKAIMCRNGRITHVDPSAVKAYLARGYRLGSCKEVHDKDQRWQNTEKKNFKELAKVYPNPSSGYFVLELPADHSYKNAHLVSNDGKAVLHVEISNQRTVTFNVGRQKRGIYFLRLQGRIESEEIRLIIQ